MSIENLLTHLTEDDRANFVTAVGRVGAAFAARTSVEVDPQIVAALPQVGEHVLSGGAVELNLSEAIEALENEPSISNELIAVEVKAAKAAKIAEETRNLSPAEKISYARARGLDRPRDDVASTMTLNEHAVVLAGLNPQQRISYARRHGLT